MKNRSFLFCTALVAFGVLSCPAYAQVDAVDTEAKQDGSVDESAALEAPRSTALEEIIVTAQKRTQSASDVPMSINVLASDTLTRAGVNDLSDLVRVVPGFSSTKTADALPIYFIRGIGFFDNSLGASPAVTSYMDEVPLPYPILTSGVTLDLERVEVLKGPQGTLFGQNSTGGALNFIPARPTATLSAGANISAGRFGHVNTDAFVSGPLSDTLRARISFQHERSADWQRSYTRDDSWGRGDRGAARILLEWEPMADLQFTLNVNGWYDKSELQQGQLAGLAIASPGDQSPLLATGDGSPGNPLVLVYPASPLNGRAADWTPGTDNSANNKFGNTSLRVNYDVSDTISLTSISSYQYFDYKQLPDPDGTSLRIGVLSSDGSIEAIYQELRLDGNVGSLNWMVGGNYLKDIVRLDLRIFQDEWSIPTRQLDSFNDQESTSLAGFLNAEYEFSNQLSLQGGVRYTNFRQRFEGCFADTGSGDAAGVLNFLFGTDIFNAGECLTVDTLNGTFLPGLVQLPNRSNNLSWRVGLNYEPNPDALLYANISRGYKTSSFPLSTFFDSSAFLPPEEESVLAYEVGFKLSLADSRVQLNGAAFLYDYRDKQLLFILDDPIQGTTEKLQNIPDSRIIGGEIELSARPVDGLTLSINGTFVDSEVRSSFTGLSSDGASFVDVRGESFPYTPSWQINGDVEYVYPLSRTLNAMVGVSANYRSSTSARFGDVASLFQIDGYMLLDLRAGVEGADGSWYAQIWGRNVTDEYYRTSVGSIFDTVIAYAGRPVTYGVSAGIRF